MSKTTLIQMTTDLIAEPKETPLQAFLSADGYLVSDMDGQSKPSKQAAIKC